MIVMRKKDGFTLIELLVVIAIIAMLLSVVMPALNQVKERARRLVCKSNLKQASVAMLTYGVENDDSTVPSWQRYEFGYDIGYRRSDARQWYVVIRDIIGEEFDLVDCPTARKEAGGSEKGEGFYGEAKRLWRKSDERTEMEDLPSPYGAYGYNIWLDYHPQQASKDKVILKTTDAGGMSARVPVVGDCTWGDGYWVRNTDLIPPPEDRERPMAWHGASGAGGVVRYSMNRHGDGINMTFLDGHVEHVEVDDLLSFRWHKKWRPPGSK